jgi:hypothetical protein
VYLCIFDEPVHLRYYVDLFEFQMLQHTDCTLRRTSISRTSPLAEQQVSGSLSTHRNEFHSLSRTLLIIMPNPSEGVHGLKSADCTSCVVVCTTLEDAWSMLGSVGGMQGVSCFLEGWKLERVNERWAVVSECFWLIS